MARVRGIKKIEAVIPRERLDSVLEALQQFEITVSDTRSTYIRDGWQGEGLQDTMKVEFLCIEEIVTDAIDALLAGAAGGRDAYIGAKLVVSNVDAVINIQDSNVRGRRALGY